MVDTIFPTPNTYTPRQGRQANAAMMAGATAARPLGAFTGVRPGTPSNTVTATTSTVTVQPFGGTADVQTAAIAGPYEFAFDTVYTVPLVAQSATVPRSDIVYVQINDNQEDGTGSTNSSSATRVYQAGTTVTVPTPPNTRTFIIAVINVPITGSSPTVTWVAPYTIAAGGVQPVDTLAHLNAAAGSYVGQYADVNADTVNNGLYRWSGTAWTLGGSAPGTLTLGSGITVPTSYAVKLERNGNIVTGAFALTNSATTPTAALGSGTVIGVLPVGFRPQGNAVVGFMGYNNSGLVSISYTIEPNGNLRAQPQTALGAGAILYGTFSFSVA